MPDTHEIRLAYQCENCQHLYDDPGEFCSNGCGAATRPVRVQVLRPITYAGYDDGNLWGTVSDHYQSVAPQSIFGMSLVTDHNIPEDKAYILPRDRTVVVSYNGMQHLRAALQNLSPGMIAAASGLGSLTQAIQHAMANPLSGNFQVDFPSPTKSPFVEVKREEPPPLKLHPKYRTAKIKPVRRISPRRKIKRT
jgi:hypothetical protein